MLANSIEGYKLPLLNKKVLGICGSPQPKIYLTFSSFESHINYVYLPILVFL
jgi:hypothetical protein